MKKALQCWQWLMAGAFFSTGARAQQVGGKDSIRYKKLQEVVVIGYGTTTKCICISCGGVLRTDSVEVKKPAADSLLMMGFLPKKELAIYPNPVRAGMLATLTWEGTETGEYEVGLFSAAGALIERQVIAVSSKAQVNLIKIPASLAKGVYILRVARAGEVRVLSRKLAVL